MNLDKIDIEILKTENDLNDAYEKMKTPNISEASLEYYSKKIDAAFSKQISLAFHCGCWRKDKMYLLNNAGCIKQDFLDYEKNLRTAKGGV